MGYVVISLSQETRHLSDHATLNPRCPLCVRFGPAPAGQGCAGRIIAINAPATADQAQWGESK